MALPKACLEYFSKFIASEVGIVYSEPNHYQLENRLEQLASALRLPGPEALWQEVQASGISPRLREALLDAATNNETLFFRDRNVFGAIKDVMMQHASERPFRVLSMACSTGQEVYSLCILRSEVESTRRFEMTVDASDFSERVLERAKAGRYSALELGRGLSQAQIEKHFEAAAGTPENWEVKAHLRSGLTFSQTNILRARPPKEYYNLILCRNVLIYQSIADKRAVVERLAESLVPDGYLVLGGSESLIGVNDSLEWTNINGTVLYKKTPKAAR